MLHTAVVPGLPASAVTHTVSGNFSGTPDELHSEVLVVRQNHLTLYSSGRGTEVAPLTFLTEFALNAPPLSVATCKSGNAKRDLIVMLFGDFHVSFVQYNPVTMVLDTVALVQLDDRESLMERCPLDAILRVDPSGTFVAVLSKRKELFLFPVGDTVSIASAQAQSSVGHGVNQSGEARVEAKSTVALDAWGDEDDEAEEEVAKLKDAEASEKEVKTGGVVLSVNDDVLMIGHITHLTLSDLKSTLRNIRDFQFVDSAGEPLIAFLYEKQPTWAGRVKLLQLRRRTIESNMLTCSVIWVKVTFASSSNPKLLTIGDVESLPFNVTHITPVPAFLEVPSAVLCFGRNTLLHVSTKNGYGAYFNANGRDEVINSRYPAMVYEPMSWANKNQEESLELIRTNLNFANCVAIPEASANGMRLLVMTEDVGTVLEVTVRTDGYAVSGFSSKIIMAGCFAACWSSVGSGRYFLGSTVGDSHVITCGHDGTLAVAQSFIGLCPINDVTIIDNRSLTGQEDHRLHESLENSPFADLYHNITLDPEPVRPLAERRAVQELVVCSGHGSNGAVSVLRNSIRNNIIRSEEVNAISVFFLESSNARQVRDRKRTRDAGTAVMPSPSAGAAAAHLLMTGHNFTILFAVRSDSVQQIRGTALNTATRTVFAAELDWAAALLQVTESQLRIVSTDRNQAIQQQDFATTMEGGSQARTAFLIPQQKALCVLFTNGQLVQFAMEDPARTPTATVLLEKGVSAATLWAARDVIVAIEGMHLVFVNVTARHTETQYPNFAVLPPVALAGVETPLTKLSDRPNEDPLPEVTHLEIFDHPHTNKTMEVIASLVIITSSGELLTYKVHQQDVNGPQRLIKGVNHFLDHKPEREAIETIEEKKARIAQERAFLEYDTVRARQCSDRLIPFKGIGGCDGVYACGLKPIFLTYDEQRNELVATRHQVPAAVRGFSPFNSRHVEGGYVYCCEGYVNFATMQHAGTSLGNGWWMHRVPLGVTPHKVAFNAATKHCYVVTSTMAPFSPKKASFDVQLLIKYEEDGTKSVTVEQPISFPPLSAASGARVPLNERYCVKYFSCGHWRCTDEYLLEENEKVLSADCIEIPRDTSMDAAPHATVAPVFALGTAFPLGEDVTTRGRLLLLASKHASGENKLRLVHSEPLKGPATAVTGIQGNIVVAVGGTISVFRFDSQASKLETLALLYAGSYVTSITAFRDYIVYGDLFHSTSFIRFSSASHTLSVLGKDVNNFSVVHTDMLYHDRSFGIIASDDDRNLAVLGYTPRVQAEGTKPKKILESLLSLEGEYRIPGGSLVKMLRLRSMNKTAATGVYVTNYGEIGFLVPLSEQVNRTGQWVARRLQADIPLLAGLPPRQFLGFKQDDSKFSLRGKEKLLHAPLINELFRLDTRTRKAVAKAALTQIDRAMNVGVTIYQETCLF